MTHPPTPPPRPAPHASLDDPDVIQLAARLASGRTPVAIDALDDEAPEPKAESKPEVPVPPSMLDDLKDRASGRVDDALNDLTQAMGDFEANYAGGNELYPEYDPEHVDDLVRELYDVIYTLEEASLNLKGVLSDEQVELLKSAAAAGVFPVDGDTIEDMDDMVMDRVLREAAELSASSDEPGAQ